MTKDQFLEKLKDNKNYQSKKPPTAKRRPNKGKPPPKGRGTKVQQDSSQAESESECECPVCGQHYGDKSAVYPM